MSCTTTCVQPSPSNAHCAAQCHETFGTVSAFDRHRRDGACLDPTGLRMHRDDRGVWRWDSVGEGPSARNGAPQAAQDASVVGRDHPGPQTANQGRSCLNCHQPVAEDGSCHCSTPIADGGIGASIVLLDEPCCDSHNRHCEPPSELCCGSCTETAHDMFPIRHGDGSPCVNARFEGHPDCDLLVARYSGGLIELGCPAMGNLDGMPAHNRHAGWHRDTVWGEASLLRIAAAVIETEADGHAEVLSAALKRLPICWTSERLHRLRNVLGVAL